jgi:thiol-disulfide isomerase/thioredoxin
VKVVLFTSSFCEPCIRTRAVLEQVSGILPAAHVVERDIVRDNTEAEREGIRSTPTTIVLSDDGGEVFRAEGVPTVNQVLVALARAL